MLSLPLPLISTFFPYTTLFRSPKEDEPIIKDVSFTIQEGEKVAILGRSGAGKSTLLKLLSGLIEPDRGEILIGNQIVNSSALARSISVLNQKPHLFNTTVANNVRIGRENEIGRAHV